MARHRARQQAMQLLFEWDLRRTPLEEIMRRLLYVAAGERRYPRQACPGPFARNLVSGCYRT